MSSKCPELDKKIVAALRAADLIARRRGLLLPEAMEFFAEFLTNHPDPEIRASQAKSNRHARKDLN